MTCVALAFRWWIPFGYRIPHEVEKQELLFLPRAFLPLLFLALASEWKMPHGHLTFDLGQFVLATLGSDPLKIEVAHFLFSCQTQIPESYLLDH